MRAITKPSCGLKEISVCLAGGYKRAIITINIVITNYLYEKYENLKVLKKHGLDDRAETGDKYIGLSFNNRYEVRRIRKQYFNSKGRQKKIYGKENGKAKRIEAGNGSRLYSYQQ